jgi:hypothetical protein
MDRILEEGFHLVISEKVEKVAPSAKLFSVAVLQPARGMRLEVGGGRRNAK